MEEDSHLDWAEEVTLHDDVQAEKMELSTDILSEKEKEGRPDRTQETGASTKHTSPDESRNVENGQKESQTACRRISRIEEQSQTETDTNCLTGSKKIKLESGSNKKTVRTRSRNRSTQQHPKDKM